MTAFDGWEARFEDDFGTDSMRLRLIRRGANGVGALMAASDLVMVEYTRPDEWPDRDGLSFPRSAYKAIVAAIDPAPHGVEVKRLEEALAVERRRVDSILAGRLLP